MKKILIGSAVAVAMSLGMATPALAQIDLVSEGTTWRFNDASSFGLEQIGGGQRLAPYGAYGGDSYRMRLQDSTDPTYFLDFNCQTAATVTVQDDGDTFLECNDPQALLGGDLTWDSTFTVFSGEYNSLVGRHVYELTNSGNTDLTLTLRYSMGTEECNSGGGMISTSSGDVDLELDDIWLLCNNNDSALEASAWGSPWVTALSTNTGNPLFADNYYMDNVGVVIAPGQTITYAFFNYSMGSTDHTNPFGATDVEITANTVALFDTNTLYSSRLWEDLSVVDNWVGSGVAPEVPTLPDTGVDVAGLILAALALAGLGAVILVRRRATV